MTLVVDAHVHLGVDLAHGFRQERSELLERMGQAGIDLAIATGFPRPNRMLAVNEELAGLLGDGILGAGLIAPGAPEASAEVDRLIDDYGMYAAVIDVESTFEYYLVHGAANSTVTATMDRLAERKLPVFIHAHHPLQRFLTADAALGVDALARRYPELPIVVNTRMPSIALTFSHPNVYVESSLDTASPVDLAHYCSLAGARRFFFASNAPVEHPKIKKMAFERAAVSEEERALMLGGSVIDVLNLPRGTVRELKMCGNPKKASGPAPEVPPAPASRGPLLLADVAGLLRDWEPFLDDVEPATVFTPLRRVNDGRK